MQFITIKAFYEMIRDSSILWKSIRTHLFSELDFDPFGAAATEKTEPDPVAAAVDADEENLFEQATVQAPVEEMLNLEVAAPGMFSLRFLMISLRGHCLVAMSQPEPNYTMPVMEPESIKLWREEFRTRIEDIESNASSQVLLVHTLTLNK